MLGLKHAPAAMRDGGSIIATSSLASNISLPGNGVYSATKRAVNSLVATAAMELGARKLRVNAVCPGYTATALGSGEEGQRICEAFTALGRMATVEDLVGIYRFLAADREPLCHRSEHQCGRWLELRPLFTAVRTGHRLGGSAG